MTSSAFHVKLEQDEDGIAIATVPALPGCVSDGSTRGEAMANVKEAIQLWLEVEDQKTIEKLPEAERHLLQIA